MGTSSTLETKAIRIAMGIVVGVVTASAILSMSSSRATARALSVEGVSIISPELIALQKEDSKAVGDGKVVVRQKLSKLVSEGKLATGADYCIAARIATQGDSAEDKLIAHHMAVNALALGAHDAAPLAALTEQDFLAKIKFMPSATASKLLAKMVTPKIGVVAAQPRALTME